LDYAEKLHDRLMEVLQEQPESRFDQEYPKQKTSLKDAVLFIANHDTYHTAQIRNMGLASFYRPRKG
jgi:uncharacterized damage-inducible protein DinB